MEGIVLLIIAAVFAVKSPEAKKDITDQTKKEQLVLQQESSERTHDF